MGSFGHLGTRRTALTAAVVLAGLGATAGRAWACTPQPRSFAISPDIAGVGASASVVGQGFRAQVPVEVRWDGLEGPLIGAAVADERGEFAAPVSIPPSPPGVHTVLFLVDGAAAGSGSVAVGRLPFDVMSPGEPARTSMATDTWSPRAESTRPAGRDSRSLVGAGLLATALVTVSAGVGVVVTSRRRATARPPS